MVLVLCLSGVIVCLVAEQEALETVAQQRIEEFLVRGRSPLDVMARLRIAMKQNDFVEETLLSTENSATFTAPGLISFLLFGKKVTITAIPEGMDTRLIVLADVTIGSPAELIYQVAKIASQEVAPVEEA